MSFLCCCCPGAGVSAARGCGCSGFARNTFIKFIDSFTWSFSFVARAGAWRVDVPAASLFSICFHSKIVAHSVPCLRFLFTKKTLKHTVQLHKFPCTLSNVLPQYSFSFVQMGQFDSNFFARRPRPSPKARGGRGDGAAPSDRRAAGVHLERSATVFRCHFIILATFDSFLVVLARVRVFLSS